MPVNLYQLVNISMLLANIPQAQVAYMKDTLSKLVHISTLLVNIPQTSRWHTCRTPPVEAWWPCESHSRGRQGEGGTSIQAHFPVLGAQFSLFLHSCILKYFVICIVQGAQVHFSFHKNITFHAMWSTRYSFFATECAKSSGKLKHFLRLYLYVCSHYLVIFHIHNRMDTLQECINGYFFSEFIPVTPILLCTKSSHSHRNEILMGNKINIFIIQASENSQHLKLHFHWFLIFFQFN